MADCHYARTHTRSVHYMMMIFLSLLSTDSYKWGHAGYLNDLGTEAVGASTAYARH